MDVAGHQAGLRDCVDRSRQLGMPDLHRIVLDPSGFRVVLGEFLLGKRDYFSARVEHNAA